MNKINESDNELLDLIHCERLDENLFRGQSVDLKTGQVYGGQVLAQAIRAAQNTVDNERKLHSAHAYFLKKGDVTAPIIYEVDRSLDGGSFSSRRVVAIQHGRQIFHLSSSFQKHEDGLEYQERMLPPLETLKNATAPGELEPHPFQHQYLDIYHLKPNELTRANSLQMWIKTKKPLPDDLHHQNSVLAYVSDTGLLGSTLSPHVLHHKDDDTPYSNFMLASLDHAIWFHRPFKPDEWFFYSCEVKSTGKSRGLAHGSVYTQNGTLVASTAQEGLIRIRRW